MASTIILSLAFLLVSTQLFLIQANLILPLDHLDECVKEVGFEGDMKKLKIEDSDFPHGAKCVLACGFTKHGLVKSDGSLDREAAIALMEKTTKPEERKKLAEGLDSCIKTVKIVPDKCETAYDLAACVVKH